jgi:hypothetical protein
MRGARAKKLRKMALESPARGSGGFYQGTLIYGGVKRAYRTLKKMWRNKGFYL